MRCLQSQQHESLFVLSLLYVESQMLGDIVMKNVTRSMRDYFYVEDCHVFLSTAHDAEVLADQISAFLANARFRLPKWVFIYEDVLEVLQKSEVARPTMRNEGSISVPERLMSLEWDAFRVKF